MRDWNPIHRGETYCSPACGMGCTRAAYNKAVKQAEALAKKCAKEIGGKWVPRVHENLGWHWKVVLEKANVQIQYGGYLAQGDYYTADLGATPVQVSTHPQTFKTPKEAFDAQMTLIAQEASRWNEKLSQITKAVT